MHSEWKNEWGEKTVQRNYKSNMTVDFKTACQKNNNIQYVCFLSKCVFKCLSFPFFSACSSTDGIIVGDVAAWFVTRVQSIRCLLRAAQRMKSESVTSVTPIFTQSKTLSI